jgi:predicted transcriptional regulator
MVAAKVATSFRLSPQALRLLARLAEAMRMGRSAWLELAIRDLAKNRKVT